MSNEANKNELERLIAADKWDEKNWYVGKHAIPKGPPGHEKDTLEKFQADMRKMGATDMQIATMRAVREGTFERGYAVDFPANSVARQLLYDPKTDRHGNVTIGDLTVTKDAFPALKQQLLAGNAEALEAVERGAEGGRHTKLDKAGLEKLENPAGVKLLAEAKTLANGDVQIGQVTVNRADFAKLQNSVLANTPDATARALRLEHEAHGGPPRTYVPQYDTPTDRPLNAEMQKVLRSIPSETDGNLARVNQIRHNYENAVERAKLDKEWKSPVSLDGVDKTGQISIKGKVMAVEVDDHFNRTYTLQTGPTQHKLTVPFEVGDHSNPIGNVSYAKPGDTLSLDVKGNNHAIKIESPDGQVFNQVRGPQAAQAFGDQEKSRQAEVAR